MCEIESQSWTGERVLIAAESEGVMAEGRVHKMLKQVALRWVQRTGCVAFACEVSYALIGIVDVAGIKDNGDVYIVEAKASNSDMRSDARRRPMRYYPREKESKLDRIERSQYVDFVYYIISDGVDVDCLPSFIGILDQSGRVRRNAKRRNRPRGSEVKFRDFSRFARACSWRAYGHVINHEQEQTEFSLFGANS